MIELIPTKIKEHFQMKLLEIKKISDAECDVIFDIIIEPGGKNDFMMGMYPDMVQYTVNFIKDNVFNLKINKFNKDFDIKKDLKIGNIFDYYSQYLNLN